MYETLKTLKYLRKQCFMFFKNIIFYQLCLIYQESRERKGGEMFQKMSLTDRVQHDNEAKDLV